MPARKKLTKTQLDKIRQTLEERRNQILAEMRGIESETQDLETGGDEGDLASAAVNAELAFENRARESRVLKQIDDAIEKIDGGDYGTCQECKEAIPPARLEALPFAHLCIDCQERFEEEGHTVDSLDFELT